MKQRKHLFKETGLPRLGEQNIWDRDEAIRMMWTGLGLTEIRANVTTVIKR